VRRESPGIGSSSFRIQAKTIIPVSLLRLGRLVLLEIYTLSPNRGIGV